MDEVVGSTPIAPTTAYRRDMPLSRVGALIAVLMAPVLLLAACATTPVWRSSGYSPSSVRMIVTEYVPPGCDNGACAIRHGTAGDCVIYMLPKFVGRKDVLDHELCHCLGWDHGKEVPGLLVVPTCPVDTGRVAYKR
jgi:hypothetical protein